MSRTDTAGGAFAALGLETGLDTALASAGITEPTAIQRSTLPDALAGRNVLGRAETGSGKTLAFGLALLHRLSADPKTARPGRPRGLVLVPTRELAQQVADALAPLARTQSLRILVVVGGMPMGKQITGLRRGVDVVIATPGRLIDLMQRGEVRLHHVCVAVLDEADHMADLGFLPAVTRILDATPADRQCLLFSATLDHDVDKLVARYLVDPAVHDTRESHGSVATMAHRVFRVTRENKVGVAMRIAGRDGRTLFFVRTKHGADRLARRLRTEGLDAVALHGNLSQNQRRRALDKFHGCDRGVLVATDVAARGIHVDGLDLVVHFDPPADSKAYAHRSGRTARAGANGTVVSLVDDSQRKGMQRIHAAANVTATSTNVHPDHPAVRELIGAAARS
jgi:superfamily II DNA/RNA helicase